MTPPCLQDWSKLNIPPGEPCPIGRAGHAAVCLGYGGDHPQLLLTGGKGADGKVQSDVWILDTHSGRWREVRLEHGYFTPVHTHEGKHNM